MLSQDTKSSLIDFAIKNRWTGEIQFTAKIDASEDTPLGVKIGLAVKWAKLAGADLTGADLTGANLDGANLGGANLRGAYLARADLGGANLARAKLAGAYLTGANLAGADLTGAYLAGADLTGAYLAGAYLTGAYLTGANLAGATVRGETVSRVIAIASRLDDPYTFTAFELESGGVRVLAGCRWFSIDEYRAHVAEDYPNTDKGAETLDILDFIEVRAKRLGLQTEAGKVALT